MLPNFLIPGAAKSGTTSLYSYLNRHPDIFMPALKEPMYFVSDYLSGMSDEYPRKRFFLNSIVTDEDDYKKLFSGVTNEKMIGEASVYYLYYWKIAIPAIKSALGDVKIIIGLRNPVDRAFSSYLDLYRKNFEKISFKEALQLEEERERADWRTLLNQYRKAGLYAAQVAAYKENFSSIFVYLFDDFKRDPIAVARACCEFLDVDGEAIADIAATRHNNSLQASNSTVDKILFKPNLIRSGLNTVAGYVLGEKRRVAAVHYLRQRLSRKQSMSSETREELKSFFRADIDKLSDIIDRDLSHWH